MNTVIDYIKLGVAFIGGAVTLLFQNATPLLTVLMILVAVDYVTGVMKACIYKELSSATGFKGLFKKFMILVVVSIGALIDVYVVKTTGVLTGACCAFYIVNEMVSIIENAASIGLPIPKKLTDILEQLQEEDDNE